MTSSDSAESLGDRGVPRLELSVGAEGFEPGRTRVLVDSTGRMQVLNTLEGSEPRRGEAVLGLSATTELVRTVGLTAENGREGKRYGLPDEPLYHFEIRLEQEKVTSIDVWRSDLPTHPELERAVRLLQGLIYEQIDETIIL